MGFEPTTLRDAKNLTCCLSCSLGNSCLDLKLKLQQLLQAKLIIGRNDTKSNKLRQQYTVRANNMHAIFNVQLLLGIFRSR